MFRGRRLGVWSATAVVVLAALACDVGAEARGERTARWPARAALSGAPLGIADAVGPLRRGRRLGRAAWGGRLTARGGTPVTLYMSATYPETPPLAQAWVDFLEGLVHGPELSTVTVNLVTPAEVAAQCGPTADACYDPTTATIVSSAEPGVDGVSPETLLAHEYGHHVANTRANPPWRSVDWGSKRWATAERICARVTDGTASPGDEENGYASNPAEAFAESYRVLNQRPADISAAEWTIVDPSFYPSEAALDALRTDVLTPWAGSAHARVSGSFARGGPSKRSYDLPTALDGTLVVRVRAARGEVLDLYLYDASGMRFLAQAPPVRAATKTLTFTICGQRAVRIAVIRRQGSGRYALETFTP
jgi:hypothetical protein